MKNFRQYRYFEYTQEEYKEIWETATFVFDTNALLNLYRYKKETREEFFKALEKIKDRLWIPHHIALEFNKNRLKVISKEIEKFTETMSAVSELEKGFISKINNLSLKKTHKIDIENITNEIREFTQKINHDLNVQLENEIKLKGSDPIRDEVFKLFEGKVGDKPQNQDVINNWEKEAEKRHKLKIAPGFEDEGKEEKCIDNGLMYQKKYSDFIIWQQILDQSKKINSKNLIFITDDSQKGDWFLKISANGAKAIQPKPELLDEAFYIGDLNHFLMYDTESFIKFAKELLRLDISDEVIDEIADTSNGQFISTAGSHLNIEVLKFNVKPVINISSKIRDSIHNSSECNKCKKLLVNELFFRVETDGVEYDMCHSCYEAIKKSKFFD